MMKQGHVGRGFSILLVLAIASSLSACKERSERLGQRELAPGEKIDTAATPTVTPIPIQVIAPPPVADCSPKTGLAPEERIITILGTNDIHGGVEAGFHKGKKQNMGLGFIKMFKIYAKKGYHLH